MYHAMSNGITMELEHQNLVAEAIYGSNAIEQVGAPRGDTHSLCRAVFEGKEPDVTVIDEHDHEYASEIQHIEVLTREPTHASIIQGRREVVQHVKAFLYLRSALIDFPKPGITEEIIKETHRVLCLHAEHEDGSGVYCTSDEKAPYGSRSETEDEYNNRMHWRQQKKPWASLVKRKINVPLYESTFMRYTNVPENMVHLMRRLNEDLTSALGADPAQNDSTNEDAANTEASDHEKTHDIGVHFKAATVSEHIVYDNLDLVSLAAKYATYLVTIHPFEDGNGRLCRILLNVLLLRLTGCCAVIGVEYPEREAWIKASSKAVKQFDKEWRKDVHWRNQIFWAEVEVVVRGSLKKDIDPNR